jgi:uncharacterized protein YndB with AHSA1/START domain
MPKLFVDRSIGIDAPASGIWNVLTQPDLTAHWAREFIDGADFYIESEWKLGSPVLWKDKDGKVIVEGAVTALVPNTLLRFTVADTRSEKPHFNEEDGITYELTENAGKTTLRVLQGDFSIVPDGQKYRDMSEEIWNRVLPTIRNLAEARIDPIKR